jgi:hypothetical protein
MSEESGAAKEHDVVAAPALATPSPGVDKSSVGYLLSSIDEEFDEKKFKNAADEHFVALAKKHGVNDYTILYLLDAQDSLSSWHSNRIYKAASSANKQKDILLVVHSLGGSIEAGYFMARPASGCQRRSL